MSNGSPLDFFLVYFLFQLLEPVHLGTLLPGTMISYLQDVLQNQLPENKSCSSLMPGFKEWNV